MVQLTDDIVVVSVFVVMAWRTSRRWVLAAAGVQVASLAAHVVKVLGPTVRSWRYIAAANLCGYGVIAALVTGVVLEAMPDQETRAS